MATIYYTASSLDGFLAAPGDDDLGWLTSRDIDPQGPHNYEEFFAGVGAMAMGATTYTWVLDHIEGDWPYAIPCWVFTHRDLPANPGVHLTAEPVASVHRQLLDAAGDRDVWVAGGGDLAGQFLDEGLLDEVRVQYAPVLLGSGAPLLPRRVDLELLEADRNREFAVARYAVRR